MRKIDLQAESSGRSWRSRFDKTSEHKVAWIGASGAVLAALITGVVALINHDSTKKESSPAVNVGTTVISSPPPPVTLPMKAMSLVLDQFTINVEDSLFERCKEKSRDCSTRWAGRDQWGPTEEWQAAVDLEGQNAATIQKELPGDGEQRRAWLNYVKDPARYKARMNPVFDVVISNPGQEPKILTGIGVIVLHSEPHAQGDGEASRSSAVIPVLSRYTVELKGWKLENKSAPFTLTQAATPPISIAPNQPARFQVALACEMGVMWDFQMRVRFDFGGGVKLQTDRFGLTC